MTEVGHKAVEAGCIVPTAHPKVESKLGEYVGMGRQFSVSGLADEGGCVVAVDKPVGSVTNSA